MKGVSKQDKKDFIQEVTMALSKPDRRATFLALQEYTGAQKFVRRAGVNPSSKRLVDNGQHFLHIMTQVLESLQDPQVTAKWHQLQEVNRANKKNKGTSKITKLKKHGKK
jgi:hypothetical protein